MNFYSLKDINLERKLKIDNEQYIVNLQLTSGIESLLGMTDSVKFIFSLINYFKF